ncbi:MAG: phosphomannomutase [Sphingomonadales bacterium]|nr:phosphomannomutase [Sphingomonadales bacterium]
MEQCGVAFGTSGARGEVVAMTDRVCHSYTAGFLQYLGEVGEFAPGARVALAGDLRASTPRILAACAQAVRDLGGEPVFCGYVPTPALAFHAFAQGVPSLMVTGSHIPDDRNGIKFYRAHGEVLKDDELGMSRQVLTIDNARFNDAGMLIDPAPLPPVTDAETAYVARYVDFFGPDALKGMTVGVYQHSAVGRDVLTRIVAALGAKAVPLARSDKFMPVDTEAIRPEDVALAKDWAAQGRFDAIVSTDGDSDRPLLADHTGEWLRGDVLGVLCARAMGADVVVTPVSSNSVLELTGAFARTARTRIGSPYVIAAMNAEAATGAACVCGYEANGGFLLGSDVARGGAALTALPTRDAVLPILAVLAASRPGTLADLVAALPPRVTYSDRIKGLPTAQSQALLAWLGAGGEARVEECFAPLAGGALASVDHTDGLRMSFANGAVIHLRPSGNAPELRCYSEASKPDEARRLAEGALALVRDELATRVSGG